MKNLVAKKNCQLITKKDKAAIIETATNWEQLETSQKLGKYRWPKLYDFVKLGSDDPILYLIIKADNKEVKDPNSGALMVDKIVRIATMEECFEILYSSHMPIGHGR